MNHTHENITPTLATHFKHGWNPDLPDVRDFYYHKSDAFKADSVTIPSSVDLRKSPAMPAIEDQGQLGSCTAFGTLAGFAFVERMQGAATVEYSHLFQYYNSRVLEGTQSSDSGATVRDAIKAVAKYGSIPEKSLPYNVAKFAHKPTAAEYAAGLKHQLLTYLRVENDIAKNGKTNIVACLAAGYPIVFGATLYTSFENPGPDANGRIPMPGKSESMLGGHCQLIVGYDLGTDMLLIRNSWGTSWALGGYEWMPFAYLTNPDLATDFWTLRKAE